jgi:hypothetical protein
MQVGEGGGVFCSAIASNVCVPCSDNLADHIRIAEDGRRAREVVKESNSGAKQNRRDLGADFIEESGIQELLDGRGRPNRRRPRTSVDR